jgi:hypothetical protein
MIELRQIERQMFFADRTCPLRHVLGARIYFRLAEISKDNGKILQINNEK